MENLKCPYCGTTFKSVKESGYVGCEHCYHSIQPLSLLVEQMFEGKVYRGRAPRRENE